MFNDLISFLYFLVALLVALTVHEASHALVAYYLGDPTAKMKGRISFNPVRHLDAIGSFVFLLTMSIGWGKPVPVNPGNFQKPVRDSALTALAGPISNFILAFAIALPLKYLWTYLPGPVLTILWSIFDISIFLGVFNLFPFPPLDGSKIIGLIIPKRWHSQYANYLENGVKYFVAIILIDVFIVRKVFYFSIFGYVMGYLHERISMLLLLGT